MFVFIDILTVSSNSGYNLAKIIKNLKKNIMEKLKVFVSFFFILTCPQLFGGWIVIFGG